MPNLGWEICIFIVKVGVIDLLKLGHECGYATLPLVFLQHRSTGNTFRILFHQPIRERPTIVNLVMGPQHGVFLLVLCYLDVDSKYDS